MGVRTAILSCCIVFLLSTAAYAENFRLVGDQFCAEIDHSSGRLARLGSAPIAQPGGMLTAYDFKAKKDIPLTVEKASTHEDRVTATYKGGQLECNVTYLISRGNLWVQGSLKDLSGTDRAITLSYTIPLSAKNMRFSPSLNEMLPAGSGSVYPIAAMCGDDFGLAMAIPPTHPCMFKTVGSADGLILRMYLGLSPESPKAHFSFMVYPCDPRWGFRDALRHYYAMFPDYYTHHSKGDGLWMFETSGPPNIGDFLYDETAMNANFDKTLERDHKNGILTFPYMIVGQREVKWLDKLPASDDEAMAIYEKWSPDGGPASKESLSAGGDVYLKEEVESSAITKVDGDYLLMLRNTPWGGNSITFTMNPNPALPGEHATGSDSMERIREWLTEYPTTDGIYIDSLGSNWCARLNFRRDHFSYARYPLTFDPHGNVALHNQLSHYEFLKPLREELHSRGRLLMANGVYCYSTKEFEYADVKDTGRFFLAALTDIAGAESSSPTKERWEFYRAAMNQKPYLVLKYHWEKPDNVQEVINQALCYDVFVTNSNGLGKVYWTDPNGYARDKALYEWFVPLVRTLSKAGWQPVTYASSPTKDLRFERYGDKGDVYFTIYNPGPEQECVLNIETKPLGLTKDAYVEQISGPGFIGADRSASTVTLRTKLAPKRTAVIHMKQNG